MRVFPIFRQRPIQRTQCAGQQCHESAGCLRFEARVPEAPWASFDLERVRFDGPCLHRINLKEMPRG